LKDKNELVVVSVEDSDEDSDDGFSKMEFLITKETLEELEKFVKECENDETGLESIEDNIWFD